MENSNALSEQSAKAILEILVTVYSNIQVLKEQMAAMYTQGDPRSLAQAQKVSAQRFTEHSQKLRALLSKNYGDLKINDLLR